MVLKGGFDFDGIFANTQKLKLDIAYQRYGVRVPMSECNRQGFLNRGMTNAEYVNLQNIVYSSPARMLKPIQGSLTYVEKLLDEGKGLIIRSYRKKFGEKIIEDYLFDHRIDIDDFLCTDNQPKSLFCGKLDFFVEDRTDHLIDLKRHKKIKYAFLLDRPYNRNEIETHGIIRVFGWNDLYRSINSIPF